MRLALLAMLVLGTTCASNDDGERRVVARELIAEVVLPSLDEVAARAGELDAAIATLVATPTEPALEAARAAWRAARVAWKRTDAFAFGPADDLRITAAIDQPIDPARIETELAGTAVIDEPFVEDLGANKKGFHAIEYVLFSPDALTALAEPRRRDLVAAYAANLGRKTGELRAAWDEFGAALGDGPTKAAIDAFVNELVFKAELVADLRLGTPMGLKTGGTPQPDLQESGPSETSLPDIANALASTRAILEGTRDGTPGKGIAKLLPPDVADRARAALAAATAAVGAIPLPFRDALLAGAPELTAAHEAVKELKRLLATEVVASLGVTLGFNDNDGD